MDKMYGQTVGPACCCKIKISHQLMGEVKTNVVCVKFYGMSNNS